MVQGNVGLFHKTLQLFSIPKRVPECLLCTDKVKQISVYKKIKWQSPRKLTVNYNNIFNKQISLIYPFKFKVIKGFARKNYCAFCEVEAENKENKDLKFKITFWPLL